ncbi:MAG: hypothetical protein WC796_01370 [Candidatus Pacearchaeota archaeon]|jgi:hypothetical protein
MKQTPRKEPNESQFIGVYDLIDKDGVPCLKNLRVTDQRTICGHEAECGSTCEHELRYRRIEGEPEHVRVYCVKFNRSE